MEIVLMNDNAIIPTRASKEFAGLDLYSSVDVDIEVGSIKKSKYWKLSVCFYHVTYAFQSESTLYSCLNVKELLARSRREQGVP